jgi:predicted tellurium resistance membrane protein TerC
MYRDRGWVDVGSVVGGLIIIFLSIDNIISIERENKKFPPKRKYYVRKIGV